MVDNEMKQVVNKQFDEHNDDDDDNDKEKDDAGDEYGSESQGDKMKNIDIVSLSKMTNDFNSPLMSSDEAKAIFVSASVSGNDVQRQKRLDKNANASPSPSQSNKNSNNKHQHKKETILYPVSAIYGKTDTLSYKLQALIGEKKRSTRLPLVGLAFNHFIAHEKRWTIFATVGDDHIGVYRIRVKPVFHLRSILRFQQDAESFLAVDWSYIREQQKTLLLAGGELGILHVLRCLPGRHREVALRGHGGAITDIKVNQNHAQLVLSASRDYTIRLWNIVTHTQIAIFGGDEGHRDQVLSIGWHPHELWFVSGGLDRSIKIWDLTKSRVYESIKKAQYNNNGATESYYTIVEQAPVYATTKLHQSYIDSVCFVADNYLYSKSVYNEIIHWHPGGPAVQSLQQLDQLRKETIQSQRNNFTIIERFPYTGANVWWSRFGHTIKTDVMAQGNMWGEIYLWHLPTMILDDGVYRVPTLKIASLTYDTMQPIRQVAFSYDSKFLVSISDGGYIGVYRINIKTVEVEFPFQLLTKMERLECEANKEVDRIRRETEHKTQEEKDAAFSQWVATFRAQHKMEQEKKIKLFRTRCEALNRTMYLTKQEIRKRYKYLICEPELEYSQLKSFTDENKGAIAASAGGSASTLNKCKRKIHSKRIEASKSKKAQTSSSLLSYNINELDLSSSDDDYTDLLPLFGGGGGTVDLTTQQKQQQPSSSSSSSLAPLIKKNKLSPNNTNATKTKTTTTTITVSKRKKKVTIKAKMVKKVKKMCGTVNRKTKTTTTTTTRNTNKSNNSKHKTLRSNIKHNTIKKTKKAIQIKKKSKSNNNKK